MFYFGKSEIDVLGVGMQESWHRRHAVQIVAALPEDLDDALIVLDLARALVETFLAKTQPADLALERDRVRGAVVSLSSAISGSKI